MLSFARGLEQASAAFKNKTLAVSGLAAIWTAAYGAGLLLGSFREDVSARVQRADLTLRIEKHRAELKNIEWFIDMTAHSDYDEARQIMRTK